MKKTAAIVILSLLCLGLAVTCFCLGRKPGKVQIKVLILPKFEVGEMTGDTAGEALDIFDTAMKNNFKVGKTIIDAILSGGL